MKKNVGSADRYIRFIFGVAFLLNIIITNPPFIELLVLLIIGLILIKTSFTGSCPLYLILKVNTIPGTKKTETTE